MTEKKRKPSECAKAARAAIIDLYFALYPEATQAMADDTANRILGEVAQRAVLGQFAGLGRSVPPLAKKGQPNETN